MQLTKVLKVTAYVTARARLFVYIL